MKKSRPNRKPLPVRPMIADASPAKSAAPSKAETARFALFASTVSMADAEETKWRWWIGRNSERFDYDMGGTREDAIKEGRGQYGDDEDFFIIEAVHNEARLPDGARFLEMFIDMNEDHGDPEGDYFGQDLPTKGEEVDELTKDINAVFTAWLDKHNRWPHVFTFGQQRNLERIPALIDPDTARDDKHEKQRIEKEL